MLVGILYEPCKRFGENLQVYEKILDFNNIEHIRMDASNPDFWNIIPKIDLFIFRGRIRDDQQQLMNTILPIIENHYGVKCFPNLSTYWSYDDKIKEYLLLKSYGFPVIDSYIFWNKKDALNWFRNASLPLVFKLKAGASSSNVILIRKKSQGIRLIKKMFSRGIMPDRIPDIGKTQLKDFKFTKYIRKNGGKLLRLIKGMDPTPFWNRHKNYIYFQKYLPGNSFDTRVVVVNHKAFAFRRLNRKKDFRSSGSKSFDFNPGKVDTQIIRKAFEVSERMQFQSMAYDFLYNERKEIYICEISYISPEETIPKLPGYWDRDLVWHSEQFVIQYLHLVEALKMPELKMPIIHDLIKHKS